MQFHANHVSTSVSGDYYQALFEANEDTSDPASPYLLLQRQFELPDGGRCYLEMHDEQYTGHFRLRRIEFAPDRIVVEIDRSRQNVVHVTFRMATNGFAESFVEDRLNSVWRTKERLKDILREATGHSLPEERQLWDDFCTVYDQTRNKLIHTARDLDTTSTRKAVQVCRDVIRWLETL